MEGKSIGNVNILDLRKATEASVAGISKIGNVNVAVCAPETAGLLSRLSVGNINTTAEVPADVLLRSATGQTFYNKQYFHNMTSKVFIIHVGQAIFETDLTAEDIQNELYSFIAIGQVICPEYLAGAIQAKADKVIGQTRTYPALKKVVFNSLTIDADALAAMEDGSELAVIGGVTLPDVLPNELIERKFAKLFVFGDVKCHQENARSIQAHLAAGSGSLKTIPDGFEWRNEPLHLDSSLLELWNAKKLYCSGQVVVDPDVTPALLDEHLAAIASEAMIFAPQALKSALLRKCDPLKNKLTFYEGELWLVDDERSLPASRFEYLEGKATLVVEGVLSIDADVDPKLLASRLAKVHNFGVIHCTPAQMGALQARLGLHDGVIDSPLQETVEEENPNVIGNANYLAL